MPGFPEVLGQLLLGGMALPFWQNCKAIDYKAYMSVEETEPFPPPQHLLCFVSARRR